MKFVHIFIIASILFSFNSLKADDVKTENKLAKNLRCLICQGQSVYEEQIYSFLKKKYGEWILYEPEFNKNTYFLWLLPILMFIVGGAIIFKLFIIKKN